MSHFEVENIWAHLFVTCSKCDLKLTIEDTIVGDISYNDLNPIIEQCVDGGWQVDGNAEWTCFKCV